MGQVAKTVTPLSPVIRRDEDYVALAIERNMAPEVLSKLIDNAARLDSIKNRKAFDAAMADAKAELPVVIKNREVNFGNGRASYKFEDLAAIAKAVDPILAKHGLSYRFRTTSNGTVTVTCIISHRDGHSEENSLSAAADNSGSKNAIQAIGSAVTYLQRYTLKAALGLAASADDDANAGQAEIAGNDLIGSDEIIALEKLIKEVGGERAAALKDNTLKYFKVESLAAISLRDFPRVKTALEKKRK